jgi:hypothetical protein
MNFRNINDMVAELSVLKFFPSEAAARLAIVRMVGEMARSEDQIRWLIRRMTSGLYAEWPGPGELRACFCSRFPPKDGINAYSSVYLDGIPSERPDQLGISGPEMKALPSGHVASGDKAMDATVQIAAGCQRLKDLSFSAPATKEEIAAAPEWLRRLEGYE